jgi:hypothetical protein
MQANTCMHKRTQKMLVTEACYHQACTFSSYRSNCKSLCPVFSCKAYMSFLPLLSRFTNGAVGTSRPNKFRPVLHTTIPSVCEHVQVSLLFITFRGTTILVSRLGITVSNIPVSIVQCNCVGSTLGTSIYGLGVGRFLPNFHQQISAVPAT